MSAIFRSKLHCGQPDLSVTCQVHGAFVADFSFGLDKIDVDCGAGRVSHAHALKPKKMVENVGNLSAVGSVDGLLNGLVNPKQ